ncbi:hypothetical protein WKH57_01140 [Niallia taxi]|uniref:hypothetical protein n=1 Tax=Niallia taxi TaxID=2499688 RepID=UPI00317BF785
MIIILKIRQSYHGTGGKEGYKFKVYNERGKKIGELKDFPVNCGYGDIVKVNGELYTKTAEYSSDNSRHEKTEVVFIELEPYELKPKYDLGEII